MRIFAASGYCGFGFCTQNNLGTVVSAMTEDPATSQCVCVCVHARVCVHACVRVCACVRVRVCRNSYT